MPFKRSIYSGFNLISILAAMAVMSLVAWLIFISYTNLRANTVLKTGAEEIISTLSTARAKTLAGMNNAQYGVHFQSDRLVLFQGGAYPGTTVETIMLDPALTIPTITLSGGGSDVVFARLTGATAHSGAVVLRLVADAAKQKNITILATGAVHAQ
jgi:hypothetical protein